MHFVITTETGTVCGFWKSEEQARKAVNEPIIRIERTNRCTA